MVVCAGYSFGISGLLPFLLQLGVAKDVEELSIDQQLGETLDTSFLTSRCTIRPIVTATEDRTFRTEDTAVGVFLDLGSFWTAFLRQTIDCPLWYRAIPIQGPDQAPTARIVFLGIKKNSTCVDVFIKSETCEIEATVDI